jgi:hypothetical protein
MTKTVIKMNVLRISRTELVEICRLLIKDYLSSRKINFKYTKRKRQLRINLTPHEILHFELVQALNALTMKIKAGIINLIQVKIVIIINQLQGRISQIKSTNRVYLDRKYKRKTKLLI